MRKSLLGIFSYAGANDIVKRHWPYYTLADCAIWGIGRTDSKCVWPAGIWRTDNIGKEGYVGKGKLCERLVDAMAMFAFNKAFEEFTDLCLIECDAIFTKGLPKHSGGLISHLAGGPSEGFLSTRYFHTPWWVDRETASMIAGMGAQLIRQGTIENDFPDRFLGLICDRYPEIKVTQSNTFSTNLIDSIPLLLAARLSIETGAYYIHGIKTEAQLRGVTDGLVKNR